jgi:serine/threonine protein phosphatase 1
MGRKIVIGDIHGALRALQQVLAMVDAKQGDQFIFLGDYVDGWPESAQVVVYLMQFAEKHDCIFLRGNHDVWCDLWLKGNKADTIWLKHGGQQTIESYLSVPDRDRHDHLQFFATLHNFVVDDSARLFIHAGYSRNEGPVAEFQNGTYSWDRTLWENALKLQLSKPPQPADYPPRYQLYKEIYIGHTPTIFDNITTPFRALNVYNVDTGAGFDGRLSAIDVGSGQYWQSDIAPDFYPGITGRSR